MVALRPANCFKHHVQLHRFEPDDDMDLDVYAQTLFASKSPGSSRYAFQWAIEGAVVAILSKIIGISATSGKLEKQDNSDEKNAILKNFT